MNSAAPLSSRDPTSGRDLGESVATTVENLLEFHDQHYREATPLQRALDQLTDRIGRPVAVLLLLLALASWLTWAGVTSHWDVDGRNFTWLELTATLTALIVSVLILVTQRREDQLSQRREKLTLELALLADMKSSKIIALLEELRRDHPEVSDRIDVETEDLARPADPRAVLAAIDEHEDTRADTCPPG